jgi:hypothetical protein
MSNTTGVIPPVRELGGVIGTSSGRRIRPFDPNPNDIDINDIAHALSHICRFNGHISQFYSVAQHCVHVSENVPPEFALAGLLHDASEAYLCDIPSPLKKSPEFNFYRFIEANMENVINALFGIDWPMPKEVKEWDKNLVVAEALALFKNPPAWAVEAMESRPFDFKIERCWDPNEAKYKFLYRFAELQRQRK